MIDQEDRTVKVMIALGVAALAMYFAFIAAIVGVCIWGVVYAVIEASYHGLTVTTSIIFTVAAAIVLASIVLAFKASQKGKR